MKMEIIKKDKKKLNKKEIKLKPKQLIEKWKVQPDAN